MQTSSCLAYCYRSCRTKLLLSVLPMCSLVLLGWLADTSVAKASRIDVEGERNLIDAITAANIDADSCE